MVRGKQIEFRRPDRSEPPAAADLDITGEVRDFRSGTNSKTHLYFSWTDANGPHNERVATVEDGQSKSFEVYCHAKGTPSKALATVYSSGEAKGFKGTWHCGRPG